MKHGSQTQLSLQTIVESLRLLQMGVDDFSEDGTANNSTGPQTTYYQFQNPDHPDSKDSFDEPEKARRQFDAARSIQDEMGTDRHNLVGEFLVAVDHMQETGDTEQLENFIETLTS